MTLSAAQHISCDVVETRVDVARIFNIQRYSLNDGSGIRTVVFFKGCPLACEWCHNPEGIDFTSKVLFLGEKCVGCGACIDHCPEKALHLTHGIVLRDDDKCTSCGTCVALCPALAQIKQQSFCKFS